MPPKGKWCWCNGSSANKIQMSCSFLKRQKCYCFCKRRSDCSAFCSCLFRCTSASVLGDNLDKKIWHLNESFFVPPKLVGNTKCFCWEIFSLSFGSPPVGKIMWNKLHKFVYKKSPPAKDKPLFVESNAHPGQLLVRLEAEYNLTLRVLLCCQIHSRGSYLIIFTCCQSPAFLIVSSWRIASWSSISFTLVIIIIDNRLFWLFETILQ